MAATRCFNACIDESGDEGLGTPGSSEWLVMAGVLMFQERDVVCTRAVDRLRDVLDKPPPKPLHWRNLRRQQQKRKATSLLASEPLHCSIVALWKPAIVAEGAPGLHRKGYLYNYAARFLIERLSWFAKNGGRQLNLLFESRATTSYDDLRRYVQAIQRDPQCSIEPNTIADVRPVSAVTKGAQLADFYAGVAQEALEPDELGFCDPEYLLALRHQLFRRPQRSILDDGFKVFPLRDEHRDRYRWLGVL